MRLKFSSTIKETDKERKARETLDNLVSDAVMKHTETHFTVFGYPDYSWEQIFEKAISSGYYNGKTVTYKTPKGTITFHAEVNAPND
jgi:hypothetical protein